MFMLKASSIDCIQTWTHFLNLPYTCIPPQVHAHITHKHIRALAWTPKFQRSHKQHMQFMFLWRSKSHYCLHATCSLHFHQGLREDLCVAGHRGWHSRCCFSASKWKHLYKHDHE